MPGTARADIEIGWTRLGISPPPVRCHLRILRASPHRLLLWTQSPSDALTAWAKAELGAELTAGSAGGRSSLLHADALPPALDTVIANVDLQHLLLDPSETPCLSVHGTREEISGVLDRIGPGLDKGQVELVEEDTATELLTERQHTAMAEAVQRGYYDVPRTIRLSELADDLDTSPSALSELLRRAEGTLARAYLRRDAQGLEALLAGLPDDDR